MQSNVFEYFSFRTPNVTIENVCLVHRFNMLVTLSDPLFIVYFYLRKLKSYNLIASYYLLYL